jgi:hypothetical protein
MLGRTFCSIVPFHLFTATSYNLDFTSHNTTATNHFRLYFMGLTIFTLHNLSGPLPYIHLYCTTSRSTHIVPPSCADPAPLHTITRFPVSSTRQTSIIYYYCSILPQCPCFEVAVPFSPFIRPGISTDLNHYLFVPLPILS